MEISDLAQSNPAWDSVFYFAYGPNMEPSQMVKRCTGAQLVGRAKLQGYRLDFQGVATLIEDAKSDVIGVIWRIGSRSDWSALDKYESYPLLYDRSVLPIDLVDGKTIDAWVYEMESKVPVKPVVAVPVHYGRMLIEGYMTSGWADNLADIRELVQRYWGEYASALARIEEDRFTSQRTPSAAVRRLPARRASSLGTRLLCKNSETSTVAKTAQPAGAKVTPIKSQQPVDKPNYKVNQWELGSCVTCKLSGRWIRDIKGNGTKECLTCISKRINEDKSAPDS